MLIRLISRARACVYGVIFITLCRLTDTEFRAHQTLNEGGHWIHDQIKKVTK